MSDESPSTHPDFREVHRAKAEAKTAIWKTVTKIILAVGALLVAALSAATIWIGIHFADFFQRTEKAVTETQQTVAQVVSNQAEVAEAVVSNQIVVATIASNQVENHDEAVAEREQQAIKLDDIIAALDIAFSNNRSLYTSSRSPYLSNTVGAIFSSGTNSEAILKRFEARMNRP